MFKINKLFIFFALIIICLYFPIASSATQPKTRIISLTPASTEILFALGLDKEIIGVSSYCNYPKEAQAKEKVGSFSSPNIEKIILLKPDLVILTGMEQAYLKSILSSLKIDYVSVDPTNLEELIDSLKEVGELTGRQRQAEVLARRIETAIRAIQESLLKIPHNKQPNVYVEMWHDPIMSIGGNSFLGDMIEKAGGRNITYDLKRSFSKINPEVVVERNPDIIILAYMKPTEWLKTSFYNRLGFSGVNAIKNKRVYTDINPDIVLRPGPRVAEGLIELHKRFYEA
ncbi:ABC transporter substrate-binding protein [Candidatus Omnitrophota bacterium]